MVSCSIFASVGDVFISLESFLRERKYKRIVLDGKTGTITGRRRDSLFSKRYSVKLEVKSKSAGVSDIEITVNPQNPRPGFFETSREEKIRSRLYFYF